MFVDASVLLLLRQFAFSAFEKNYSPSYFKVVSMVNIWTRIHVLVYLLSLSLCELVQLWQIQMWPNCWKTCAKVTSSVVRMCCMSPFFSFLSAPALQKPHHWPIVISGKVVKDGEIKEQFVWCLMSYVCTNLFSSGWLNIGAKSDQGSFSLILWARQCLHLHFG